MNHPMRSRVFFTPALIAVLLAELLVVGSPASAFHTNHLAAGQQITLADNLEAAGNALGLLPLLPAVGTPARLATKAAAHADDVVSAATHVRGAARDATNLTEGTKVYRVFGGKATPFGNPAGGSFTTVNPAAVDNFREAAGLYPGNTGRFVLETEITNASGIMVRPSLPGPRGIGGGLPEVIIPNAEAQVKVLRVSGVNPEF